MTIYGLSGVQCIYVSAIVKSPLLRSKRFSIVAISKLACSFVPQRATEELRLQDCIIYQGKPLRELLICKEVKGE